jgi:cytochrome d ubiquinol oxidase subunit II
MQLADVPLIFILAGLAAYAVLGGADFGAGFWQLLGGGGERARAIREHAHHAIGPVWETNHVWLIFVLVVCWTAYPTAFGSIASTLAAPFYIAAIGIIMRGTAYALRSGTRTTAEQRVVEVVFSVSSILTPFALGAVIGGIASGRVPVGNAAGDLITSWINPTSALVGTLAVVTAAYLAAVYLAADATRLGRTDLVEAFRIRALASGLVAGAVAIGGLFVVRSDAPELWDGLTGGAGLASVVVSAAAGAATLALVWRSRFDRARATATVAVVAIIAGWGFAQRPTFLPGLTIEEAAAGRSTLIAVVLSVVLGAMVLVPSLAFLFGLVLRGRFDEAVEPRLVVERPHAGGRPHAGRSLSTPRLGILAAACLGAGTLLLLLVETSWGTALGVAGLLGFVGAGFVALAGAAAGAGDEG